MIGNTPLLKIKNLNTHGSELFVKMECQNPSGSLKDRMAVYMVNEAEKSGKLKPGDTIIEASAGNTVLALAHVAVLRGYKSIFVVHDRTSDEKISHLKALGAKVIVTSHKFTHEHPDYYQNLAARIASETPNSFYTQQFSNPINPLAYEETLAPEIWKEMDGKVDAVVASVGSGGHMTGLGHFIKKNSPTTKLILADPEGSMLEEYFRTGKEAAIRPWLVEGIGTDVVHKNAEMNLVDDVITISDRESFKTMYALTRHEAIFGSMSSGTVVAAALRYLEKQTTPKRVVTFIYDTGYKYLSKIYNPDWLKKRGLDDLLI